MISAGWIIPILLLGVIAGTVTTACVAGGSLEEKCDERCNSCLLMYNATAKKLKPPTGRGHIQPPQKHGWEILYTPKPKRSKY